MPAETSRIQKGIEFATQLRIPEAEDAFRIALREDPESIEARLLLARILLLKAQTAEADQLLDEVLKRQPQNGEAFALKGIGCMNMGDFHGAIVLLERANNQKASQDLVCYGLTRSYRNVGNLVAAESSARRAVQFDPKNHEAFSELGSVLWRSGKIEEAIQALLQSIRVNPAFVKGYLILSRVYCAAGFADLADKLCREGLRHVPDAIALHEELCQISIERKDHASAYREAVEVAVRRQGYSDFVRLGDCASKIGAADKAGQAYGRAMQLNPDRTEAFEKLTGLHERNS